MFHHLNKERSGSYLSGSKEDLAIIFNYQWKSPRHMREAIKLLLASYLDDEQDGTQPKAAASVDEILYAKERAEALMHLAANPDTNEELLEHIRKQVPGIKVLEYIATNPRCSAETLYRLARHKSPEVRAAVTEHQNCQGDLAFILANDVHPDVRYRLAENVQIGPAILQQLSEDENPFVAARAKETIKRLSSTVIAGRFPTAESSRLRVVNGE